MTAPRGVVLLEGADCSGKTTLARCLVERYRARYLHGRVFPQMWRYHCAMLRLALRWADRDLVVIDRLHLSELIYGAVYRGGPAYDLGARCLDRVLQRASVTVLCAPLDQERQLAAHAARREQGGEVYPDVRRVVAAYADLAAGNLATGFGGYLGQLTQFGPLTTRADVLLYAYDAPGETVERTAARVLARLAGRRRGQFAGGLSSARPNFAGYAGSAAVLFVGEAPSPRGGPVTWPLCWHDGLSAATWLNRALAELRFDEARAIWCNALHPTDDALPALLPVAVERSVRVVALGRVAQQRCRQLGHDPAYVAHPQHARRFEHHDQLAYQGELTRAVRGLGLIAHRATPS